MYDKTTQKRARTMALRAGLLIADEPTRGRNKTKTTTVATIDIVANHDKRLARYESQPDFWHGAMSGGQRKRLKEKGIPFTAKTRAWQASEANAKWEAEQKGHPFKEVKGF